MCGRGRGEEEGDSGRGWGWGGGREGEGRGGGGGQDLKLWASGLWASSVQKAIAVFRLGLWDPFIVIPRLVTQMRGIFSLALPCNARYGGIRNFKMLVTPLVLIQILSMRMLVDWPKCGSDPRDEGHLACLPS